MRDFRALYLNIMREIKGMYLHSFPIGQEFRQNLYQDISSELNLYQEFYLNQMKILPCLQYLGKGHLCPEFYNQSDQCIPLGIRRHHLKRGLSNNLIRVYQD